MEPNVVYCSACDRNVEVIVTEPAGEADSGGMLAPVGICLDYCAEQCTGSMCAHVRIPEAETRGTPRNDSGGIGRRGAGGSRCGEDIGAV